MSRHLCLSNGCHLVLVESSSFSTFFTFYELQRHSFLPLLPGFLSETFACVMLFFCCLFDSSASFQLVEGECCSLFPVFHSNSLLYCYFLTCPLRNASMPSGLPRVFQYSFTLNLLQHKLSTSLLASILQVTNLHPTPCLVLSVALSVFFFTIWSPQ